LGKVGILAKNLGKIGILANILGKSGILAKNLGKIGLLGKNVVFGIHTIFFFQLACPSNKTKNYEKKDKLVENWTKTVLFWFLIEKDKNTKKGLSLRNKDSWQPYKLTAL
jgi:hypothetical protein